MKKSDQFEIVHELPEEKWRSFVENHPNGNVFQTPEMFEVFQNTLNYTPHLIAALSKNGNIQCLIPAVNVTLYPQVFPLISTRSICYGGILVNPEALEILPSILQAYSQSVKNNALFTEFRNLNDLSSCSGSLMDSGFEYEDHINYLVDTTQSPEILWKNMSNQARRNIKKSQKAEIQIVEMDHPEQVDLLYNFLDQTFKAVKVPIPDISLFKGIYDIMRPKNLAKFMLAKYEDQVIGAGLFMCDSKTAYSWYYSANDAFRHVFPTDAMIWHMIQWCHENGYKTFDFQWAGRPNETYGVRRFKEKYKGKEVLYGRHVKVHHPFILKMSKTAYGLKRLIKRGSR